MRSIPFGYRIENGTAVIDEKEGPIVRQAFRMYLEKKALRTIGQELGISRFHKGIANILENKKYLGTDFYPRIIEDELFAEVQEVRALSKKKHARSGRSHVKAEIATKFRMEPVTQNFTDPFEQAQYVFGLIQAKE